MSRPSPLVLGLILVAGGVTLPGDPDLSPPARAQGSAETAPSVAYPEGYRYWAHVKSMVIQEGHTLHDSFGGIHHVYANPPALAALEAGKPYPDGSIFVFDLLEARAEPGAIVEGGRKFVGVMVRDEKKFSTTGGWGFQAFHGDTRDPTVTDPATACFTCHEAQRDRHYIYSQFRR